MSENSRISWTDASWQPTSGCSRRSAGCEHCYAELLAGTRLKDHPRYAGLTRMTANGPRWTGDVRFNKGELMTPLKWRNPRHIFVDSMGDLFHENVPFEWVDRIFAVMALCPKHTFQVLTKRPDRMAEYLNTPLRRDQISDTIAVPEASDGFAYLLEPWVGDELDALDFQSITWPLPNVWLGTSCENQAAADERIPQLLRCPAAVRWLSLEPLIGPIDLDGGYSPLDWNRDNPCKCGDGECHECWQSPCAPIIHWVVVGGESGAGFRPMEVSWLTSIVDLCMAAGVPAWVKQDAAFRNERQGRIPDRYWALRQMPGDIK